MEARGTLFDFYFVLLGDLWCFEGSRGVVAGHPLPWAFDDHSGAIFLFHARRRMLCVRPFNAEAISSNGQDKRTP